MRAFSDRVGTFFLGLMARAFVAASVVREPCEHRLLDHLVLCHCAQAVLGVNAERMLLRR